MRLPSDCTERGIHAPVEPFSLPSRGWGSPEAGDDHPDGGHCIQLAQLREGATQSCNQHLQFSQPDMYKKLAYKTLPRTTAGNASVSCVDVQIPLKTRDSSLASFRRCYKYPTLSSSPSCSSLDAITRGRGWVA